MGVRVLAPLVVVAACSAQLNDGPLGAWSTPIAVPGACDPMLDTDNETLNSTMTEMYFTIVDNSIQGSPKQLWVMTRASFEAAWGTPKRLDVVNTPVQTESPRLSPDDLTLYFGRNGDIFSTTRSAVGQPWGTPQPVASVNTSAYEKWLAVCDGGYFMVSRFNGAVQGEDLFEGKMGEAGTVVAELSSRQDEISTFLSSDCLTTYFASDRGGSDQIYTATRAAIGMPWTAPTLVTDFGMASTNKDGWLSPDARTFYLASIRDGDSLRGVYVSTR